MTRSRFDRADGVPDRAPSDSSLDPRAREDASENAGLRRALLIAAVAHLALFGIQFPEWSRPALAEPSREVIYVVRTPVFAEEPEPPREIPQPRAPVVPIPDPTPNDPEPIPDAVDEPVLDLQVPTERLWTVPPAPPEPVEAGPVPFRAEMERPRRIEAPPPIYTEAARRAGVEGVVVLQAILDEEGRVTNVRIVKDLPFGLGDAAARAVREWRFTPATLNGKAISVYYNLTVNFGIE